MPQADSRWRNAVEPLHRLNTYHVFAPFAVAQCPNTVKCSTLRIARSDILNLERGLFFPAALVTCLVEKKPPSN